MQPWVPGAPRRTPEGHHVPAGASLPGLVGRDPASRLLLGRGATVHGVRHVGSVVLGAAARVAGDLHAGHEAVLGAGSGVSGDLVCDGRVVVQSGATVGGTICAGGDVLLLGSCRVGRVESGGDIIVAGAPSTGDLRPSGRVVTRAW